MSDKIQMTESEAKSIVGTYGVHQFREWSDEHRFMHKIAAPYSIPPARSGERVTEFLTHNAARKLTASCEYVALKHGGFKTFLTLTFDAEARARIDSGETTVQKETSRFFDGLQKMYQRGWVAKTEIQDNIKVAGHKDKLQYLWVAECPDSVNEATGEVTKNPHVHVLMNWAVPHALFEAWRKRIEFGIWGLGFAHLEKMRSKGKESAAGYLMKALQYLAKAAGGSDQGTIKGNRYAISSAARAPEWETVSTFAWAKLGQLIEVARMQQNRERKPLEQKRDFLKEKLLKIENEQEKHKVKSAINKTRVQLDKIKGKIFFGRNRVLMQGNEAKNSTVKWFESKGFEWFSKPLSLYSYFLSDKIKRENEKIQNFLDFHRNSGFELKVSDWFEKYEPVDYGIMRRAENWLYNEMNPSDIYTIFQGDNEITAPRSMLRV